MKKNIEFNSDHLMTIHRAIDIEIQNLNQIYRGVLPFLGHGIGITETIDNINKYQHQLEDAKSAISDLFVKKCKIKRIWNGE